MRLVQGDFGRSKEYDADPVERAREWERRGAEALHVVDLDGAKEGRTVQLSLVREISRSVGITVQAGGGVRSVEDVRDLLDSGASRIVMGTAALDRDLRLRTLEEARDSLVVAVDSREGTVATHGWLHSSGVGVLDLAQELASDGVASVLYTDVGRDGMGSGPALEETEKVASIIPTVASGGVRGVEDIAVLSGIEGVVGAVVGTALYEGQVTLEELLERIL